MSEDRFRELMDEARCLPNTPTRVAMLEEAVREADLCNDAQLGFEARTELVEAATFSGLREKAMVAYSWCLAHYDRNHCYIPWWFCGNIPGLAVDRCVANYTVLRTPD